MFRSIRAKPKSPSTSGTSMSRCYSTDTKPTDRSEQTSVNTENYKMYLEVDDLTKKTKPSSATYTIIAGGNMLTSAGTFYRIGNTTDWKFCIASPTKEEIENYERMKSPDMKAVDFASLPKESIDSSTVVAKGTASETPQSIDFANESGISLKVWLEPVKQTGSTE